MKIFTNNSIMKKTIIALVIVTLINFSFAPSVQASSFGGKLMGYIRDFVTALADVSISVIQLGITGEWRYAVAPKGNVKTNESVPYWIKDKKFRYPRIKVSPELIFAGEIELLDIDFIGNQENKSYILKSNGNAISELRKIIASWYVTLRTISMVGLLSVLIYIGIKIIMSSTSQDRAKYKQRLVDWIVAFCLLFFMHYIMSAAINVVEKVNDTLDGASNIDSAIPIPAGYGEVKYTGLNAVVVGNDNLDEEVEESNTGFDDFLDSFRVVGTQIATVIDQCEARGKIEWVSGVNTLGNLYELGLLKRNLQSTQDDDTYLIRYETAEERESEITPGWIEIRLIYTEEEGVTGGSATSSDSIIFDVSDINEYLDKVDGMQEEIAQDADSLTAISSDPSKVMYYINYVRLFLNVADKDEYIPMSVGYLIIYIVLVVFTGMFAIRYMKRVIYIAFLTLMAPLVALTYPIDKIKDGKAQAFNMWFREYIFNVLIQPFHYLIYTILIGAAVNLVSSSVIYAVVAIGFMLPAEKLMRKFFGFDNSGTLSAAGSFAGGAVFSAIVNKLNRPRPGGRGGAGGGAGKEAPRQIRKTNTDSGVVNPESTLLGTSGGARPQTRNVAGGTARGTGGGTGGAAGAASAGTGGNISAGSVNINTGAGGTGGTSGGTGGSNINLQTGATISDFGGTTSGLRDSVFRNGYRDKIRLASQNILTRGGNAIGAAGYRNYRKLVNTAKTLPGSAGRLVRRAAVGGAVGLPLAMLGAGVGIASGDPSKAFQYAAAGGAAGYYGANYYGDKVAGGLSGTGKTAANAFWGSDTSKLEKDRFDREFKQDPETIDALTKALGSRGAAKEAISDGSVQALLNNGISDKSKVAKALKLKKEYKRKGMNDDAALQRAVAMAKWNKDAGKGIYEVNSRARQSFIEQTMKQIQENDDSITDNEARSRVEQILKDMESFEL